MKEHVFLKEWKKENIKLLKLVHPDWDEDDIEKKLDKIIDKNLKNPDCALHNNYIHKLARTTVLDIIDYIDKTKPIMAGGGVLFKNQHEVMNPPSKFLDMSIKNRKRIKKGLKTAVPGSYEYMMIDLAQMTEKVVANSYYGASGNESSPFFNIFTALATTGSGQSLISTMMTAFESFYANNIKFYNNSDMLLYVKNSINKKHIKRFIEINDMPEIIDEQLQDKLESMYARKRDINRDLIKQVISNLDKFEKQKLYYSSYLFEFIKISSVEKVMLNIIYETKSFKDPNEPPKEIVDDMDYFWDLLYSWVVYDYPHYNRINRLKSEKRKVVVTIDTDSNMLNIGKWMNYWDTRIDFSKLSCENENELMYIKCNIMCYMLTKLQRVILDTYARIANIPDDYAPLLNMKNEFLFLRMVLTSKKKRYAGLIRLREGAEIIPEKVEKKGLDLMKSTTSEVTKKYFSDLIYNDILVSKDISGTLVLKKVKEFGRYIDDSLSKGEKLFLNPLSVKEPEAYDKPYSNQGVRGTYVWNLIYPDKAITLPDKITVVKVNLEKESDLEKLKDIDRDVYEKLLVGIFNNPKCGFRDKGVNVVAIPNSVDRVPDWITHFINKDKIINDNLVKIHPILESLGLSTLDTRSNNPHFTNIITF